MVAKFALSGAVGFGVGFGIMGGLTALWVLFVAGGVGGLFLGLAFGGLRKVILLSLFESLAFGIGSITGFFVLMTIWDPVGLSLVWVAGGALSGTAVGVFLRSLKGVFVLSVCGALGFGLGAWVVFGVLIPILPETTSWWAFAVLYALGGVSGGGLLGASTGFLRARLANEHRTEPSDSRPGR